MLVSPLGLVVLLLLSGPALAATDATGSSAGLLDLTRSWVGVASIAVFLVAYVLVMLEEFLHLRKSKSVLVASGVIWAMIALAYSVAGDVHTAEAQVRQYLLEFGELFLFLLAAMTFINTMEERGVFDALRVWLVGRGWSLRRVFWITGLLAFFISPIADNLTTALLMGAVVGSVGAGHGRFVLLGMINVVVAANAGGAFSPFGDITTLMVWQKGVVSFSEFFVLFLPSVVNWLVPATIMSFAVEHAVPAATEERMKLQPGAFVVVVLFLLTIGLAVTFHSYLHLPPVLGMMTGLGLLKLFGYRLKRQARKAARASGGAQHTVEATNPFEAFTHEGAREEEFDIFKRLEKAEWDTLLFFYGVILCVGGLGTIGYLGVASHFGYDQVGPTIANIGVGILSAIVDNIPVMFAVLSTEPAMSHGQWLLVTLTAGVGGSLLSIGSAAGVALMGQARGTYTFFGHLRWTWAIALGYAASIWVHFLVNGESFHVAARH
jgi:Na+/H+ antiporter NhaD/arsenite permease-like protein